MTKRKTAVFQGSHRRCLQFSLMNKLISRVNENSLNRRVNKTSEQGECRLVDHLSDDT